MWCQQNQSTVPVTSSEGTSNTKRRSPGSQRSVDNLQGDVEPVTFSLEVIGKDSAVGFLDSVKDGGLFG